MDINMDNVTVRQSVHFSNAEFVTEWRPPAGLGTTNAGLTSGEGLRLGARFPRGLEAADIARAPLNSLQ